MRRLTWLLAFLLCATVYAYGDTITYNMVQLVSSSGTEVTINTDGSLETRIVDSEGDEAGVDGKVGALQIISTPHHEIHEEERYSISHVDTDVDDNDEVDILVQVGANKELHTTFAFALNGLAQIAIFEGTTFSSAGTAITAYNLDRASSNTSDATITHTPTISSVGTLIYNSMIPGGSTGGQRTVGDTGQARFEFLLNKSTDYTYRLTNIQGDNLTGSINLDFYEED